MMELDHISSQNEQTPENFNEQAIKTRKITHRAIKDVTDALENLRFNRAIAHIYELSNQIQNVFSNNKSFENNELYANQRAFRNILQVTCANGSSSS